MDYLELYWFLKNQKLKFWKHRCLRKLRKYLCMYVEPYNYLFAPPYITLLEMIELQRNYCYLCGYDTYNLSKLKNNLGDDDCK